MSKKKKPAIPSKPPTVKPSRHLLRRLVIVLTKVTLVVIWVFFSLIGLGNSGGFATYLGLIGITLLFGFLVYFIGDLYDEREA